MFLVLNLGLKSIRSIIFDDQFNIISSSSRPLKTYHDNTIVEQCPKEWWSRGIEVINDSISRLNRSKKISSFTVTASSCCVVPTDAFDPDQAAHCRPSPSNGNAAARPADPDLRRSSKKGLS